MEARFNKIYDNLGYFDRYNGSVFGTVFLLLVFFILISYFYTMTRITPLRNNWTQERCSPSVIPFAGLINPPAGKNGFEFTYENFNFCINSIIKDTVNYALMPIEAVVNLFNNTFSGFGEAINDVRKIIAEVRSSVADVSSNIMTRILNVVIPFQQIVITMKATMGRAHASMTAGMYSAIGGLWFLISGLLSVYKLIIAILVGIAATLVALWLIPFGLGIPEALALTATFAAVAIPTGLVAEAINTIIQVTGVNQSISSVPTPSCFKKGTLIRDSKNTLYTIENLPLGTYLAGGAGYVTAVLKLDASRETMYQLGNVVVSGSHKVKFEKEWIFVSEHKDAKPIKNFTDKEIYCLNTSKKIIPVGDYLFQDWDEVDKTKLFNLGLNDEEDVFKNLENGFHERTQVNVKGKGNVEIHNVNVGDILKSGEKVVGVVKIKNNKPLYEYGYGILGTKRLSVIQELERNPVKSDETADVLFHILTDKGTFHIKEQKFMDYNWNIDFFN
jgi:hypothetical protein